MPRIKKKKYYVSEKKKKKLEGGESKVNYVQTKSQIHQGKEK